MKLYLLLAASGFANDLVLTSYYVHADRGHVWTCVGLCGLQQMFAIFQSYHSLLDPASPAERVKRLLSAAAGYTIAAYVSVSWLN